MFAKADDIIVNNNF